MCKTFILTALTTILFAAGATAQDHTWMIYGGGVYDNVNYTPPGGYTTNTNGAAATPLSLTGWDINLGLGYQLSKHIMIGVQGGYGKQDGQELLNYYAPASTGYVSSYFDQNFTNATWQAGLFGRYTSWLGKRFYVYGQAYVGKYGSTQEISGVNNVGVQAMPYNYNEPSTPEGNGLVVSLFPAVGVNILQGFGVHMDIGGISYSTYNAINNSFSSSDRHHVNITLGQQFSFGIHKIIGWNKFNKEAKEGTTKP